MSRSVKAHILLVLITFIWGVTFVVIKNALDDATPLLFNAIRMVLAAAALVLCFRREFKVMTRASVVAGIVVGIFLWLGYEFQTTGLKLTSASKSAFLTGMSVVLVPIILAVGWRKKLNHWSTLGVIAAFVGLYLMTVPANGAGDVFSLEGVNLGDLLTLGCAIAFAFQIIMVGRTTVKYRFEQIVVVEAITCAVLMVFTVPLLETPHIVWSQQVVWAILVTGLLGTAAAWTVQAWAQQFTPPTHTALIFALEPVFAVLTSYVVLGERLGIRAGVGSALILAGVLISELLSSSQETKTEMVEETGEAAQQISSID
ncbi:MAG TPA: DMT family transporter [Clostridia bacterium]|nr:DMT family transporter [Clostridia bacterium]